jgi:hypothetical protein
VDEVHSRQQQRIREAEATGVENERDGRDATIDQDLTSVTGSLEEWAGEDEDGDEDCDEAGSDDDEALVDDADDDERLEKEMNNIPDNLAEVTDDQWPLFVPFDKLLTMMEGTLVAKGLTLFSMNTPCALVSVLHTS